MSEQHDDTLKRKQRKSISKSDSLVGGLSVDFQMNPAVDKELDEALDKFAEDYNLTAQNVKNIIYVSL